MTSLKTYRDDVYHHIALHFNDGTDLEPYQEVMIEAAGSPIVEAGYSQDSCLFHECRLDILINGQPFCRLCLLTFCNLYVFVDMLDEPSEEFRRIAERYGDCGEEPKELGAGDDFEFLPCENVVAGPYSKRPINWEDGIIGNLDAYPQPGITEDPINKEEPPSIYRHDYLRRQAAWNVLAVDAAIEEATTPTHRRFLPEAEYLESFDEDNPAPPFLAFQPFEVREGVRGYLVPCPSDHPDAEEQSDGG